MRADYLVTTPPRQYRRGRASQGLVLALDSDGTVFDSMRSKHLEAFAPAFARHFAPSCPEAALEVWRFVNLESRSRGLNRYRALVRSLNLLAVHPAMGRPSPEWTSLASVVEAWLSRESAPSKSSLERAVLERNSALKAVLAWTKEVDAAIAGLALPKPFAGALTALPAIAASGEIIVLSAAPEATIRSEWKRAGILGYAADIDGQERGPKASCLVARRATASGPSGMARALMVGDAPADLEAARSAGAAFFPIIPGREEECWAAFSETGLSRFLAGEASPGRGLLADFLAALPLDPPWASAASRP